MNVGILDLPCLFQEQPLLNKNLRLKAFLYIGQSALYRCVPLQLCMVCASITMVAPFSPKSRGSSMRLGSDQKRVLAGILAWAVLLQEIFSNLLSLPVSLFPHLYSEKDLVSKTSSGCRKVATEFREGQE